MGCGGGVSGSRYADIVCNLFYQKSILPFINAKTLWI